MESLIGKKAPHFKATAVENGRMVDNFSLSQLLGQYVVFFFYPLDFTFVCPTELHAFQDRLEDFKSRGTEVVACSIDSCFSHCAWLTTSKLKGGIEGVSYPIVSDINKEIARNFHVLKEADGIAYRGLFLIDREGVIRYLVINDLPLGRSVDETLRMIDALKFYEQNGEVCPANWKVGDKSMKPTAQGLEVYFKSETRS